jgi:Fe-S-cluster containining protein
VLFWIVESGVLIPYERKGECLGCGICCRGNNIRATITKSQDGQDDDGLIIERLEEKWEGYSVFQIGDVWRWYKTELLEEERVCTSLVGNKCECWQTEEWPEICRYWPFHPRDLEAFPECGFTFEMKRG